MNTTWPYVCWKGQQNFSTKKDYMCIFNANDKTKNRLIRAFIPQEIVKVIKSHISDSYELFFIGETQSSFKICKIDLDCFEQQDEKINQIFDF